MLSVRARTWLQKGFKKYLESCVDVQGWQTMSHPQGCHSPLHLPLRKPLLSHHRKMNLTRGIDLQKIANMMSNASGAELKGCCTESGMFALRERRVHVTQEDFEMAVAKVMKKVRGAGQCGWAGIGVGQPAQGACCNAALANQETGLT